MTLKRSMQDMKNMVGDQKKGKVEYYRDSKGNFRWRLVSDNGSLILDSGSGHHDFEVCRKQYGTFKSQFQDAVEVIKF